MTCPQGQKMSHLMNADVSREIIKCSFVFRAGRGLFFFFSAPLLYLTFTWVFISEKMKRIKVPSLQCCGHKTSLDISTLAGIPAFKPQPGINALNLLLGLKKNKYL